MFDEVKVRATCVRLVETFSGQIRSRLEPVTRANFIAIEVRKELFPSAVTDSRKAKLRERIRPYAEAAIAEYERHRARLKIATKACVAALEENGATPDPALVAFLMFRYFHSELLDITHPTCVGLRQARMLPIVRTVVEVLDLARAS